MSLNNIHRYDVAVGNWSFVAGAVNIDLTKPDTIFPVSENASSPDSLPSARHGFSWACASTSRLYVYGGVASYFSASGKHIYQFFFNHHHWQ